MSDQSNTMEIGISTFLHAKPEMVASHMPRDCAKR